jgi:cell division protein FtsZ
MIYDVCQDANIIMGSVIDESMGDEVVVTVIATGIEGAPQHVAPQQVASKVDAPVELRPAQSAETQEPMKNHHDQMQNFKGLDPQDLEIPTYLRRAREKELLQK